MHWVNFVKLGKVNSLYCLTTQVVTYRCWVKKITSPPFFNIEKAVLLCSLCFAAVFWFNQTQICLRLLLTFRCLTTETNHFTGKKRLGVYKYGENNAGSHTPANRWCALLQLLWFLLCKTYRCLIYYLNLKIFKNMYGFSHTNNGSWEIWQVFT